MPAPECIKQTNRPKGEKDSKYEPSRGLKYPTYINGYMSSRQEVNKGTLALTDTLDQMGLTDTEHAAHRIHILLKCVRNIPQDKSHTRPQSKS